MPLLFVCQSVSKRNSSSRRGVVVASGVAQCGCSACVRSTRLNQSAKYPGLVPLLEFAEPWAQDGTAGKNKRARKTKAFRQMRTHSPPRSKPVRLAAGHQTAGFEPVGTLIRMETRKQIVSIQSSGMQKSSQIRPTLTA